MVDVTIVTPVFNDPRVGRALESIFEQTEVPEVETIVVDGESTDETVEVLDAYSDRIDVTVSGPDEGVYDAMNTGIERASGDVVGILNADDVYQDEYVIRDVLSQLEGTGADTCYGNLVYVDESDEPVRYWRSKSYRSIRFYFGWMPPHPTFFVRRSLYDRYGAFDLDFPIAADYELMLRYLLKYGVSTTYIDGIMVRMGIGGQSNESLGNIIQANREVLRAWRKNGLRGGYLAPFLKPARKIPQFVNPRIRSDTL